MTTVTIPRLLLLAALTLNANLALAQNRTCSKDDYQACKTCPQLSRVVDMKDPEYGDYFHGAEWNPMYAAFVHNCQALGTKLIHAGADPLNGGSFGSMILTVASKWPHNNKKINEEWAALLFTAGARLTQTLKNDPLNYDETPSTATILERESSWYKPDYPQIIELFRQ